MILLDTHVVLWQELDDRRLGPQTRRTIERALQESMASVSAISFWEVGMRVQKSQLELGLDLHVWRHNLLEGGLTDLGLMATLRSEPVCCQTCTETLPTESSSLPR